MSEKHLRSGSTLPALKPGVIRLYSMKYCPFAQRARLVLAHKNIPHEVVNIHLKDKPDWFLLKNPQGTVPAVEVDDKLVYESTAVSEWLDDVHASNRLQPSDPYRKAWDRILLEYFGKLGSAFYTVLLKPEEIDKVAEELGKHYKYYEETLAKRGGPYFGGTNPAMIDFYIWPVFERLQVLGTRHKKIHIDKSNYPKLSSWIEAISTVPAVKKTTIDTKALLHFLDSAASGTPDFDYGIN
uniref:Glutathione S-transferase omega n=1 Tax=Arion vulgaris TaxID=1028688 RepID=A0A0B6Y8P8_9EUPU